MKTRINVLKVLVFIPFLFLLSCKTEENLISEPTVNYFGARISRSSTFTRFELPTGGIGTLPKSFDLSDLMPPVRNQGQQGSCVAFALSYLKSYQEQQQFGYQFTDDSKIMSPAFLYNQFKAPGDCDAGAYTIDALNFLKQYGVCTESDFLYDETTCSLQPNQNIKEKALANIIKEWKGFDFSSSDVIVQMKYAITQKQPVVIDYRVDKEFCTPGTFSWGGYIWKENSSGDPKVPGNHCSLLVGYNDTYNAFLLLNSWGQDWKNNGYCWVDYDWLLKRVHHAFITWDDFGISENSSSISITGSSPTNVQVGANQSFIMTINNVGTSSFNVTNFNLTNNTGAYSFANSKPTFPFAIQPGGKYELSLKFAPTTAGEHSSSLVVNSDAESGNGTITLSGTAITNATSIISLSGNLSFGNVNIGSSAIKTLTISNTGSQDMAVSSIGLPNSCYTSDWNSGVISAGSSLNATITFTPTGSQSYNGLITVYSNAASGVNTIAISGSGIQNNTKTISLSGNLSFGNVIVGNTSTKTFTITNTGTQSLTVSSISLPYTSYSSNWSSGTISAGGSKTITITFAPTSVNSYDGVLTVNSDASNNDNSIDITGNGISQTINIIPSNSCLSAPVMSVNTEYSVNISTANYSLGAPIEGHSFGSGNIRGFWLQVNVPDNYSGAHSVKITNVSSNFDPVIGMKGNCNSVYLAEFVHLLSYVNRNGKGEDETFTTNMPGTGTGYSDSNDYYIRIYHYYGDESPTISFKIKIE